MVYALISSSIIVFSRVVVSWLWYGCFKALFMDAVMDVVISMREHG